MSRQALADMALQADRAARAALERGRDPIPHMLELAAIMARMN